MAASALADVLPDFGVTPAPHRRRGDAGGLVDLGPAADEAPAEPVVNAPAAADPGAEDAAAEEALREALASEHEEALAAERARHAEELETLRGELGERAGALIAERFAEMEGRVVELATSLTARILGAALTEDLQKRSVEHLSRVITEAIDDREAVRVRVHGAPRMLEALTSALGDKAGHVDFAEAPGLDLTVAIDDSLFETRMSEWSEALSEVLS